MSGDEGEWSVVTKHDKKRVMRRRGRGGGGSTTTTTTSRPPPHQCGRGHASVESILRGRVDNAISEQHKREAYEAILSKCRQELDQLFVTALAIDSAPVVHGRIVDGGAKCRLVCYGIGNFSEASVSYYSASMYQLALAFNLREAWNVDEWYFLDPCINPFEETMLRAHGFQLLDNKQGRQTFFNGVDDAGRIIIFFMPHCPRRLYENVVCAHKDCLGQVLLLGNSLRNYVDSMPAVSSASDESSERSKGSCLEALYPYIRESPLDIEKRVLKHANGNLEGALNDTYWTSFASSRGELCVNLQQSTTDDDAELL